MCLLISNKCCDIEDMGFKGSSFYIAFCAFGIFFLPDMENGLSCISKQEADNFADKKGIWLDIEALFAVSKVN